MRLTKSEYPNLELLEYKAFLALGKENKDVYTFEADVFQQWWGCSCTAFDIMPDGSPTIGCSAMTPAYTVVMHEVHTDTYVVFVDNRLCYIVENANEEFHEDLVNRNMASLSEAKKIY